MKEIKTLNYLGSKLRILKDIGNTIDEIDPDKGMVCDLFAGSGTVSAFLSENRKIICADIQEYSRVICSALLNRTEIDLKADKMVDSIKHDSVYTELSHIFLELIEYENNCRELSLKGNQAPLADYLERVSIYSVKNDIYSFDKSTPLFYIQKTIVDILRERNLMNNSIITQNYGGIYFSVEQAIQIDSSISWINNNYTGIEKDKLTAAVISAVSEIVNTVGKQFAQPINPRNGKGEIKENIGKRVEKDRGLDYWSFFEKWIKVYMGCGEEGNIVRCADYMEVIGNLPDEVSVVYADPPYTRYHYSRYYHVLETIALYDMPVISTVKVDGDIKLSRGMYREGRYQSPFCIKSKALNAMKSLIEAVYLKGKKLVISYSPYDKESGSTPRLMDISDIVKAAGQYYNNVSIKELDDIVHSKLNKKEKNYKIDCIAEVLIVCE